MALSTTGLLLRGLRQSPWLTAAMIVKLGFAGGIAAMSFSMEWALAETREPAIEERLFRLAPSEGDARHTRVLSLDVVRPGAGLLSAAELDAAVAAAPPLRASATFMSWLPVSRAGRTPARVLVRFCDRALFDLFDFPWLAGGPWSAAQDVRGDADVVVLGRRRLPELLGEVRPEEALGQRLLIRGQGPYTIVGITPGPPRAYAATLGVEDANVDVYLPFSSAAGLSPTPRERKRDRDEGVACGRVCAMPSERWASLWVEARTVEDAAQLVARANERLGADTLRAEPMADAMVLSERWPTGLRFVTVASGLLLLLAALSVSGMLQGKFDLRVPELRVHRALGASAAQVFRHHALEIGAMWLITTALALALGFSVLALGRVALGGPFSELPVLGTLGVLTPLATLAAFALASVAPLIRVTALSPGGAYLEHR